MSDQYTEQELALQERLRESQDTLQAFQRALDEADARIDALAQEKPRYDLLSNACEALQALDELDSAHLFWGDSQSPQGRLEIARRQLAEFEQRQAHARRQRDAVVEKIEAQVGDVDDLQYDLQFAIDQEERRRNNWVVERELDEPPFRMQVMPWTRGFEEDRRFRRSLGSSVMASLVVGVLIGTIALPVVEREETAKLPERVAKLVRQERKPLPPPEPVEVVEDVPLPEPEPEPELAQVPAPEAVKEVVTPRPVTQPAAAPPPVAEAPVKPKGLLAFRDKLASSARSRPSARLGNRARLSSAGEAEVTRATRNMVATSAPGSSGGIDLADISRNVGGGGGAGIDGVAVSRVESAIGGGDAPDRPLSAGVSAGRTDEEIQIVFDRYKAALYRLYNRELRKNPTLRGQLVLQLRIEPDGSVSLCQLQSSSMDAPGLAQQIVNRVLTFDFGAKIDVAPMTIIYPIDFLPAA